MYRTDMYEGMLAESVTVTGHNGDEIGAYFARPLGEGPFPGVVLIHHLPGWDEFYRETTRRFAHHGYLAISPNLYHRDGHGDPEDVAAMVRAAGGVPDEQVVGDVVASARLVRGLPQSNGKIGVIGTCSGGRHTVLAASRSTEFDAAVDCWGGRVVMPENELTEKLPVAPIDYTADLASPLLGIFGAETRARRRMTWRSTSRRCKNTARTTSSTCTRAPGTASSTTTAPPTAWTRRWTAGTRSGTSSAATSAHRHRAGSTQMCTMIAEIAEIEGSAKGPKGWVRLDRANVTYDHPFQLAIEHSLNIDFVNAAAGPDSRIAVELDPASARALVRAIEDALARGAAQVGEA